MTWFILIAFFTIFAVVLGKRIYDINSGKNKRLGGSNDTYSDHCFHQRREWVTDSLVK